MSVFPPIKIERDPPSEHPYGLIAVYPPVDAPALDEDAAKKKKLTKEEKKELRKKKELEDRKQQFRDYLDRELKYTEVTYKRAAADWEAMCGAIKLKELSDDMTELWQGLNRALDNRNSTIQRLLNELDIAEEQYRRNFSKHADILEYLTKLFQLLMDITRKAYEQDAADLVADFQEDINEKNEIHAARKRYYENILHATNLMTANILEKKQARFTVDVNEILDTHVAKRLHYRDLTVRKMEQLQKHYEKIVADLQEDALNPKREQLYKHCVQRQERASKEIQASHETSRRLYSIITAQQAKLLSSENQVNTKVVKLRGERSYLVEHYWQLKQSHKQHSRGYEDHIKCLAYEGHRTIKRLQSTAKYGELVLGLAAYCRKLETEKEKVTPWTETAFPPNSGSSKQTEDVQEQGMAQVRLMHLFWNRVGQAEAQVLCLREEKQLLEKENENFREIIKSYGDTIAYNKIICSLRISPFPTACIPVQEASQIPQLKRK